MAYATVTNWKNRFADDAEASAVVDGKGDAAITALIEGSDTLIDTYLGVKNKVPIDTALHVGWLNFLRELTLDISVYDGLSARGDLVSAAKRQKYDDRIAWLKDAAAGKAVLPAPLTPASTESRAPKSIFGHGKDSDSQRLFTRETVNNL